MSTVPATSLHDYTLHVHAGNALVAAIAWDPQAETFSMEYAPGWIKSRQGHALSPHLPLAGGATSASIRRFIENLLPEGRALDVASVHANIQKNNIFGLIRHLGAETAGALSFHAAEQVPQVHAPLKREVSQGELQERIDARNEVPFSVWDGRVRISVAGYQDKLLVLREGGKLYLADGGLASTHILKPEPLGTSMPCMVANEHFCMTLASRISMLRYKEDCVAQVEILRVPSPVLSVKRFDRHHEGDEVRRIHIIDGCQALDLPVSAKYERNMGTGADVQHIRDGASFARIFQSARPLLERPAEGVQRLLLWAVTTLLLGNSDAHGKNISFFCRKAGLSVAPLYDLVSVVQYDSQKYEHDLAMAFGDEFNLRQIGAYALADFCMSCGIPRAYFARELATLCNLAIEEAEAQSLDPIYIGTEVVFVRELAGGVAERARALLAMASKVPGYRKEDF